MFRKKLFNQNNYVTIGNREGETIQTHFKFVEFWNFTFGSTKLRIKTNNTMKSHYNFFFHKAPTEIVPLEEFCFAGQDLHVHI